MKILLTGRNGQVGRELQKVLQPLGSIIATDRIALDLGNNDSIRRVIRQTKPDMIVNSAAYTAVDKAESEPEIAMQVNGAAPGVMAEEAKRLGALLVHYSTDYVFDGGKQSPYTEDDTTNPLNVYGRSKRDGEMRIQASGCRHLILRTSWIYGLRGRNFLLTVLDKASKGERLRVVGDQFGVPNWNVTIARASRECLAGEGLFHLTASGMTSWYGFASAALKKVGGIEVQVEEIRTSEYPAAARRPGYSVLSSRKLEKSFGVRLPEWQDDLAAALALQAPRR